MKKLPLIAFTLGLPTMLHAQTLSIDSCITTGTTGNIAIFANYDGGVLTINVDQNIPNLKIGVCTYEPVTINLSGPFVNNVTEVRYAGYVSTNNNHCPNSPSTTTIVGAPSGAITNVLFLPPATLSNPNGYSSIVCAYSCNSGVNQGGCNTADQIKHYFETTMGGTAFMYFTQYGCWNTSPYSLTAGGNCSLPTVNDTTTSSFTSSATAACVGANLNFTDMSPNAVSWSWTAPGSSVPSSGAQNLTGVIYHTAGTYTVTLTVNDGDGTCSTSQTITIFPQPSLTVTATPNPICERDTSLLQASGALTYQWSPVGPTVSSWLVTTATDTWYYVDAYDANGCSISDSILLTVNPTPSAATITYAGGTFMANPSSGSSYQWYLNGVPIAGADSSSYTPTSNGDYTVSYTDANGCESILSSITPVSDIGLGLDILKTKELQVFPNPGNGIFYIETTSIGEGLIEVMDMVGQVVYSNTIHLTSNAVQISIPIIRRGIYQVVLTNQEQKVTGKYIVY